MKNWQLKQNGLESLKTIETPSHDHRMPVFLDNKINREEHISIIYVKSSRLIIYDFYASKLMCATCCREI